MLFKEDFIKMKIGTEIWVNNIARSGHYQEEKIKFHLQVIYRCGEVK